MEPNRNHLGDKGMWWAGHWTMVNLKSVGDSDKIVKQVCILSGGMPEIIDSSYGRTTCYVSLKESLILRHCL